MIFGALVAAFNDLAFNLPGYIYLLLNDIFTAGNGVVMKKKLNAKDLGWYNKDWDFSLLLFFSSTFPYNQIRLNLAFISHLGKYGLLFYNSLLMLPVTVLIAYCTGDLTKSYEYPGWSSNPITGK